MNHFNISFTIPGNQLSTILQVLSKEVKDLKVIQLGNGAAVTVAKHRRNARGSRVNQLVMEHMGDGKEHSLKELQDVLVKNRFAATSARPAACVAIKEGLLVRTKRDCFQKAKAGAAK